MISNRSARFARFSLAFLAALDNKARYMDDQLVDIVFEFWLTTLIVSRSSNKLRADFRA
jgi:hypothetical protein